MITEITGALAGIKSAGAIIKFVLSEAKEFAIREKVMELQGIMIDLQGVLLGLQDRLFTLQQENAALHETIKEKEAEIAEKENWKDTETRYKLTDIGFGAKAYAYKGTVGDDTPAHYICPICYEKRKKSILQAVGCFGGQTLKCFLCGSEYRTPSDPRK